MPRKERSKEQSSALKQEQKGLVVVWAKILDSDGNDRDAYSSRSRRVNFIRNWLSPGLERWWIML